MRHEHFGRAAEASGVSQPALSMQIRELEETLGSALFERGMRQVKLTGFGETVSPRIHDILRSVDELGDIARIAGKGLAGPLRLGVIPTIAPYLLPGIIRELSGSFTGTDVQVRETLTDRLIAELSDGRIDAAIVALPVSEPSLQETALFDEEFVLVRPVSAQGEPVPDRDNLRAHRLLLLEEGHCFRDQALSFCNISPSLPRDGLDGSSLATLVQLVGSGIGITLIPEMAVGVETGSAPVVTDRFSKNPPHRTVGMIWRRSSPLGPQLEQVAEVVRKAAAAKSAALPRQSGNAGTR